MNTISTDGGAANPVSNPDGAWRPEPPAGGDRMGGRNSYSEIASDGLSRPGGDWNYVPPLAQPGDTISFAQIGALLGEAMHRQSDMLMDAGIKQIEDAREIISRRTEELALQAEKEHNTQEKQGPAFVFGKIFSAFAVVASVAGAVFAPSPLTFALAGLAIATCIIQETGAIAKLAPVLESLGVPEEKIDDVLKGIEIALTVVVLAASIGPSAVKGVGHIIAKAGAWRAGDIAGAVARGAAGAADDVARASAGAADGVARAADDVVRASANAADDAAQSADDVARASAGAADDVTIADDALDMADNLADVDKWAQLRNYAHKTSTVFHVASNLGGGATGATQAYFQYQIAQAQIAQTELLAENQYFQDFAKRRWEDVMNVQERLANRVSALSDMLRRDGQFIAQLASSSAV